MSTVKMQVKFAWAGGCGGHTLPPGPLTDHLSFYTTAESVASAYKSFQEQGYFGVNAREFDQRSRPFKAALAAAKDHPKTWAEDALGIRLCVKTAYMENGELICELESVKATGVADGMHLGFVALWLQGEGRKLRGLRFPLSVFLDIGRERVLAMSQGVSTTRPVSESSRANQRGEYDDLRITLAGKSYLPQVRFAQGGKQPIDVLFFAKLAAVFHPALLQEADRSCKSLNALQTWCDWPREQRRIATAYLPTLAELYDTLVRDIPEHWGRQSYAQLAFVITPSKRPKPPATLYFLGQEPGKPWVVADYYVPDALVLLLLMASRVNVRATKTGKLSERVPWEVFRGEVLYPLIGELAADYRRSKACSVDHFRSRHIAQIYYDKAKKALNKLLGGK